MIRSAWLRPVLFLYSLYAMLVFVALMLLVFPFVIIASFFGRIRGGNMIFRLCAVWAGCWFALVFIRNKKTYEVPHDKSKQYIFVSNHISYLDAAILPLAFRQPMRALGKVELARIPVFGFIYRNAIVTVDRSSAANRALSLKLMQSVIRKGISVMVFPEGTFNMTGKPVKDFYDGAFRVAIETQTPVKPVLFLDAFDRMHYSSVFRMSPGRNRIVYLEEIPVDGLTVEDLPVLREKVSAIMSAKLRQYKAAWINDNAGVSLPPNV
ncbi:MAG: 1-acyl-sn-glycerol-3-phosphate acyltransferase [Chitinophagaceae bacterium]|nr:MAG: 1-acyl-sn-glycerol-3-phosphate acyltransferase [Chitinophagaceae bacterium]